MAVGVYDRIEDELGDLGHLRKATSLVVHLRSLGIGALQVEKCGPLTTFLKLRQLWSHKTADWTGPQDGLSRFWLCTSPGPCQDNDRAITPSIRVKEQPKTFDEKVAQKAVSAKWSVVFDPTPASCCIGEGLLLLQRHQQA